MGTDKGNEDQLRKRLEMVNWGRSYNSLTFLDKDDDYNQYNLQGIPGLADLMEQNMWLISAALEMQGILYGDLKGGLSQESDALKRYAITIMNRCNSYVRPVMQKLLMVLFAMKGMTSPVDFDFNSLVIKDENNDKMASMGNYIGTLIRLNDAGIISKYQVAQSLENFMDNDVVAIQFTDENKNRLKLEEQYQILEALKQVGKDAPKGSPEDIIRSQFGENSESLPEKLSYLDPTANEEVESSAAQEQSTEEIQEEVQEEVE